MPAAWLAPLLLLHEGLICQQHLLLLLLKVALGLGHSWEGGAEEIVVETLIQGEEVQWDLCRVTETEGGWITLVLSCLLLL
jgi:hypothetical protein